MLGWDVTALWDGRDVVLLPGCWQGWDARGSPAICRACRRVQPRCGDTAGTGTHGRHPCASLFPDGYECARHGWILIAFKPRCQLLCCWNVFYGLETEPGFKQSLFFHPSHRQFGAAPLGAGLAVSDLRCSHSALLNPRSPKLSPVHSGEGIRWNFPKLGESINWG